MEQSSAESMKLRHKLIQLSRYSDSEKKVFAVYPLKLLRNINKSLPCQGVFTMNYDYTAKMICETNSQQKSRSQKQVSATIWTCESWVFCYTAFRVIKQVSHFGIPSKTVLLNFRIIENHIILQLQNQGSMDLVKQELRWKSRDNRSL